MSRIYIITGGAGHLGNTIARRLVRDGKKVRVFVLPTERTEGVLDKEVEIVRGDIRDKASIEPLFANTAGKKVYVIHTAGIVTISSKFIKSVYDVNVTGTKNIVEACEKHKVEKLVYISSVHAIPEKAKGETISEVNDFNKEKLVGLYAQTKAEATAAALAAAKRGLNVSVVHPSGIIGPYDYGHGHMTQLIVDYMNGRLTAAIKGGYDFVDVRDVAAGTIECCEKGRAGECYILSNRYVEVKEMLNTVHEITGKKKITLYLKLWFVKSVAPLCEAYYKMLRQTPLFTAYSIYTLGSNSLFSHEKATRELGYRPRPLEESLRDGVEWLAKEGRIKYSADKRTARKAKKDDLA